MYMVTIAARISSSVLPSEDWNASAAPWKRVRRLAGSPSYASAERIDLTASPSEAPRARLNEIVVDGNCPRWLITSEVGRSDTRAIADRRTGSAEPDETVVAELLVVCCPEAVRAFWLPPVEPLGIPYRSFSTLGPPWN